jgi:hypothetical protein
MKRAGYLEHKRAAEQGRRCEAKPNSQPSTIRLTNPIDDSESRLLINDERFTSKPPLPAQL